MIREVKRLGGKQFQASYIVFRMEYPPSFLTPGTERDVKYCYALIIEYGDYVVINRSGGNNFLDGLNDYVEKVNSDVLNAAFMDPKSDVRKAGTQSISPAKSKVSKVTMEGKDLATNMPVQGAGGRSLSTIKHETGGELITTLGNQAKLNISNSKVKIKEYLARILFSIEKFAKKKKANSFLANFSKQLTFRQYKNKITPKEFLLLSSELRDYLETKYGTLPELFYKLGRKEREMNKTFNEFINSLENSFDVTKLGTGTSKRFFIENKSDKELELNITDKGIDLTSQKFGRIWLRHANGETENLQRLINRKNFFSITFNQVDIYYTNGKLLQDSKMLGNLDGFLQMFIPETEMTGITSEKGVITAASTTFTAASTFEYVERVFAPKLHHLILDDLGYEYADYIGIKNLSKIQLIHCKESDKKFSASAFQEIVGQALKNIHFFIHPELPDQRLAKWNELYPSSNIARNRTNNPNYLSDLKATLAATNSDNEVYLVVNFISKALLEKNLNKVKKKVAYPKATLPILWILNSLRNECLERNVKLYIICKP